MVVWVGNQFVLGGEYWCIWWTRTCWGADGGYLGVWGCGNFVCWRATENGVRGVVSLKWITVLSGLIRPVQSVGGLTLSMTKLQAT